MAHSNFDRTSGDSNVAVLNQHSPDYGTLLEDLEQYFLYNIGSKLKANLIKEGAYESLYNKIQDPRNLNLAVGAPRFNATTTSNLSDLESVMKNGMMVSIEKLNYYYAIRLFDEINTLRVNYEAAKNFNLSYSDLDEVYVEEAERIYSSYAELTRKKVFEHIEGESEDIEAYFEKNTPKCQIPYSREIKEAEEKCNKNILSSNVLPKQTSQQSLVSISKIEPLAAAVSSLQVSTLPKVTRSHEFRLSDVTPANRNLGRQFMSKPFFDKMHGKSGQTPSVETQKAYKDAFAKLPSGAKEYVKYKIKEIEKANGKLTSVAALPKL
jgi:hypothetical protein